MQFRAPEANLSEAVKRIESERQPIAAKPNPREAREAPQSPAGMPAWRQALATAHLPLYDVHWPPAVIVATPTGKNAGFRVGLPDGSVVPLTIGSAAARRILKLYDVVYVQIIEGKGKSATRAELRVPPSVQGAALVLENTTGRILAMTGGFSYPLSQLSRATQTRRQPGSALKPITYLAALQSGLQPNTLVADEPITLPPIGDPSSARLADYWSPRNYDYGSFGITTLRRALENSRNLATARLLDGGIKSAPEDSLERVCETAMEAQLYSECVRYYPFVLGAQPVRMIDLAAFYAAIANEGARPSPHAIESIEQDGQVVYRQPPNAAVSIGAADAATFYQLKSMLQGVVERGTARSLRHLAPYIAGKTGTTDNENDAWFVGFSNEVTVAVWVGYDNADGRRRTLGSGETGGKVSAPIFEPIMQAVWAYYAPRTVLKPPSAEARRQLIDLPIDFATGERLGRGSGGGFVEHFRVDRQGQLEDTQYRLVSRPDVFANRDWDNPRPRTYEDDIGPGFRFPSPWRVMPRPLPPAWGGFFGQPYRWGDEERPRPRRVDPDYPWRNRGVY